MQMRKRFGGYRDEYELGVITHGIHSCQKSLQIDVLLFLQSRRIH